VGIGCLYIHTHTHTHAHQHTHTHTQTHTCTHTQTCSSARHPATTAQNDSATKTRTWVARARAEYPNQLVYSRSCGVASFELCCRLPAPQHKLSNSLVDAQRHPLFGAIRTRSDGNPPSPRPSAYSTFILDGTRTRNLLLRREAPYPLGHTNCCSHPMRRRHISAYIGLWRPRASPRSSS
jgi:hypothetical protein